MSAIAKVSKGFLQACINHGCLNAEKINNILTPLCEAYGVEEVPADSEALKQFVQNINKDLNSYNQALTFIKHPLLGGEEFLVFGLTFESQACKRQAHFTDEDRHYFSLLLETIVNREQYGIPWVECYSVGFSLTQGRSKSKTLSKNRIQELVQLWTSQGYFIEKDDMLYFGPRMMVEYATHFKMHFPSLVKDCPLCGKLVWWDVKCSECDTKIHRECIRTYLTRKSNCPSCQKTWNTRLSLSQ